MGAAMKKLLCILALATSLFALSGLAGCGQNTNEDKLNIVCTTFPQYDWVRNLTEGDENVELTVLQTSGQDLHNYNPSVSDMVKIYQCDVFIFVGGESDKWVTDVLKSSSANPEMVKINLLEALGDNALVEEEVPGAEEEDEDEEELDEHVWLSLKNAKILCKAIVQELSKVSGENASLYESNLIRYTEEIDGLEQEYSEMMNTASRKTLLFADRFPFRYLAEDYGLTYFAAFSGCSAESEASFGVIMNLSKAVDEHALPYILILEGSERKIANQVIANTEAKNQQILEINSIQSVTKEQTESGVTYLSLMQENLSVLTTALN